MARKLISRDRPQTRCRTQRETRSSWKLWKLWEQWGKCVRRSAARRCSLPRKGKILIYGAAQLFCLVLFSSAGEAALQHHAVTQQTAYSLSDINAGYIITKAFADAYPDLIEGPEWHDGDWRLLVRGKPFYWASGRLLRPEDKAQPDYLQKYGPYRFYDYPEDLPPQPGTRYGFRSNRYLSFSDEQIWQGLRPVGRRSSRRRNKEFYYTLLNTWKRSDMDNKNVVKIRFLNRKSKVHRILVPALKRIDSTLQQARKSDEKLDSFLKGLRNTSAYVWRNIAGTQSLSLHSYGIAIDLIPRRWDGDPYWLWVKRKGLDWRNYPYEKRWQIPQIVIKTFEKEGFIWGGKWFQFDTMHFEYHPEIRLLKPYFRSLFGD